MLTTSVPFKTNSLIFSGKKIFDNGFLKVKSALNNFPLLLNSYFLILYVLSKLTEKLLFNVPSNFTRFFRCLNFLKD